VPVSCTSIPTAADEPLILTGTLIQSFANPTHPVTRCSLRLTGSNVSAVKFISRTEIGYATNTSTDSPTLGVTEFWRLSLIDKRPLRVAKANGSALDFAWSPDGSNFAYLMQPGGGNQFWMKVGATAPRALTAVLGVGGREFVGGDELTVRFSPDGKYLLMVDTIIQGATADRASFQIRSVPAGKLVWVPPSALKGPAYFTSMTAWSHLSDRLYFDDGLERISKWDPPATIGTLAANSHWYAPSISPDDRLVAYEASVSDGKPHVAIRDLVSGTIRMLSGNLGRPTLISDQWLIESHMVYTASPLGAYWWPGSYHLLNLLSNVETALPKDFAMDDVWVG